MIKLKFLGHIEQSFFRKCMNVHHIYDFTYEQDEKNYFGMKIIVLSIEINNMKTSKKFKILKAKKLKEKVIALH